MSPNDPSATSGAQICCGAQRGYSRRSPFRCSLASSAFLAGLGHFCFRRSASRRSRCALMRLISSSIAAISSSRRALFDLEESPLRIFPSTFSTRSLVVLVIVEPLGRKEALSSDNHSTTSNCRRKSSVRMIAQESSLSQIATTILRCESKPKGKGITRPASRGAGSGFSTL
jgi:hypothetical protein